MRQMGFDIPKREAAMKCYTSMARGARAFAAGIAVAVAIATPLQAQAAGSTPVTVVNATELAKAMGVQHPFQTSMTCEPYRSDGICELRHDVPSNQRLVIEYVSMQCWLPSTARLGLLRLYTSVNGTDLVTHYLNPGTAAASAGGSVEFGHLVKIYAAPGSRILFDGDIRLGDSSTFCTLTLSGQAIDVP
jgi:hypothetical protein